MIHFLNENLIPDIDNESYEELFAMTDAIYDGSDEANKQLAKEITTEDIAKTKEKVKEPKKEVVKVKKTISTRLFDPKNNVEHAKEFDGCIAFFKKILKDKFDWKFNANRGITIFQKGDNAKKILCSFNNPKISIGPTTGFVYFPVLKTKDKLIDIFGEEYNITVSWSGGLFVKDVTLIDFVKILNSKQEVIELIVTSLSKRDEKLGNNRKKLEDNLKSDNQKVIAKMKNSKKKEVVKTEE